jgi:hypothetical protein
MLTDEQIMEIGIIYETEGLMSAHKVVRFYTRLTEIKMSLACTRNVLQELKILKPEHETLLTRLYI